MADCPIDFSIKKPKFDSEITIKIPPPPPQPLPPSNGIDTTSPTIGKQRITRPFKAYPKDPLTYTSVGMYGLSLENGSLVPGGGNTQGGSPETLINQQSNIAYAEFRKQMLNQVQGMKGSKRGSVVSVMNVCGTGQPLLQSPGSDSIPSPTPASVLMSQFASLANGYHHEMKLLSSPEERNLNNSSSEGECSGESGGGSGNSQLTTGSKRSSSSGKTDQQLKDEAYWERRRKNNEAAKRSRDARRAKEDEIAIRAAFLEQENLKLRFELCALKNETAKLRYMLYNG